LVGARTIAQDSLTIEGAADAVSALEESQEFSNGLVELMRIAYDFGKDKQRPESLLKVAPSSTPGNVIVTFDTNEPAAVFYNLDGSTPTLLVADVRIGRHP